MFITNEATPGEILSQLITRQRKDLDDSFKSYQHNDDLCPAFEEKVELILTSYSRHRATGVDIQGYQDEGAEVILQYKDHDGHTSTFALQVKSYREIEKELERRSKKDKTSLSLVNNLILQQSRAASKHRPETFFILLCGDGGKRHRQVIRDVGSAFSARLDIKVIKPAQAWNFFQLDASEIAAYCTRELCKEDYVLKEVNDYFSDESAEYRKMVIALTVLQIEDDCHLDFNEIVSYACDDPLDGASDSFVRTEEAMQSLMHSDDLENENGDRFRISRGSFNALRALYYDLGVRHGLTGSDAIDYLILLTDD